ncbi:IclR family transcriptional regulator [Salirhabdus salicampi]|uniref:IclR family transcriptional regulator n=1 Tax=Salirhabdus salicampi TaxID=476102 RepID=UPI0020C47176|nr:IclR family transcriptional regulator [Salirhabdus salicampi]MCP8617833.1 IclR family transcriptional regulator [Salirhabdus salicampi]
MDYFNKTVLKSIEVLELFKQSPELTLKELECKSELPKSTLHRVVRTLEHKGLLQRNRNQSKQTYQLGLAFLQYGQMVKNQLEIRKIALPYMQQLKDQVNESVNLIIRDQDKAIYIEKVDTNQPVRVYTQVGRSAPLYAGACPRVLLSFLKEDELNDYVHRITLHPIGSGTITDPEKLYDKIYETRKLGFTVSHSELENESSAVGVPIRDYTGEVIAGLSIAGPSHRFTNENIKAIVQAGKNTANKVSAQLGFYTNHHQ